MFHNYIISEAICCLRTSNYNVAGSEVMVADTCVYIYIYTKSYCHQHYN